MFHVPSPFTQGCVWGVLLSNVSPLTISCGSGLVTSAICWNLAISSALTSGSFPSAFVSQMRQVTPLLLIGFSRFKLQVVPVEPVLSMTCNVNVYVKVLDNGVVIFGEGQPSGIAATAGVWLAVAVLVVAGWVDFFVVELLEPLLACEVPAEWRVKAPIEKPRMAPASANKVIAMIITD